MVDKFAPMARETLPGTLKGTCNPACLFAKRHESGAILTVFRTGSPPLYSVCWMKRASVFCRPYRFAQFDNESAAFAKTYEAFEKGPPHGFAIVRRKSTAVRDSQRQRVYNWEKAALNWRHVGNMTLAECEALAHKVWLAVYPRATPPKVRDGRGRRSACYEPCSHSIKIPKWARFPEVVLHEVAHAMSRKRPAHGPEFVGVYLALLAAFGGYNADTLKRSLADSGVKWSRPENIWKALNFSI